MADDSSEVDPLHEQASDSKVEEHVEEEERDEEEEEGDEEEDEEEEEEEEDEDNEEEEMYGEIVRCWQILPLDSKLRLICLRSTLLYCLCYLTVTTRFRRRCF